MPRPAIHVAHAPGGPGTDAVPDHRLDAGIDALQADLELSETFPPEVEGAARAAAAAPRLPSLDRTDLPLVTIDPEGARDLDQALHVARDGDGYVVHYAIADVAAFVTPGDPVDAEAHRRGETLYGADRTVLLHPPTLAHDAASLLPDRVRPALLWTVRVDDGGEETDAHVERALVRSRAQLTYEQVQAALDGGLASTGADAVAADFRDALGGVEAAGSLPLLAELGALRLKREAARGGVSLPLPDQVLTRVPGAEGAGEGWRLDFREQLQVESWNAQVSLLTGMAAASLMVYAQVGLLRTLPPADPHDVARLHRTARALGLSWPAEQLPADFVRGLDARVPAEAAMVVASTRLLRGSGYVGFSGAVPADAEHAALASEYAHVTAPLRRLADRYAGEVCVAICAGEPVPAWVLDRLEQLPGTMASAAHAASRYVHGVLDLCESLVLEDRVGETFDAVVTDVESDAPGRGTVMLREPAVEAPVRAEGELPLGQEVRVTLTEADPSTRRVRFALA